MTTSQQRAAKSFHARRQASGWRKVTIWLDPISIINLDILRAQEGSLDKAVAYAVRMSPTREQVDGAPYGENSEEP